MSINYVDEMDNEPVGIKRLVNCQQENMPKVLP